MMGECADLVAPVPAPAFARMSRLQRGIRPARLYAGHGVRPGAISLTKIYRAVPPPAGNYRRTGVLLHR